MDAAEDDHFPVGFLGFDRKAEGVAGDIGNLLDFVTHIVMSDQQGVALFCQLFDFLF
jgi:hypothetical protein